MSRASGLSLGLALCSRCRLVARRVDADVPRPASTRVELCPRCGAALWQRKPASLSRCLAYLVAAMLLYVPANLLPVMHTQTVFGIEDDTILSGVLVLIQSGSWPLGALVFFASIVVPLLKLFSLSALIAIAGHGSVRLRLQATRLYRLIEFVGRWSMLDVYVITLLVGLVQIRSLATIEPGIGAIAFGAVVVCTMQATQCFDPRLLWDGIAPGQDDAPAPGRLHVDAA
jgi:paraquat-inducible protein A